MDRTRKIPAVRKGLGLSGGEWTGLVALAFTGQLAWGVENQFFNTFMYNAISPDPGAVAWLVAASAITATITSILMGAASDRVSRRKPFILAGYMVWGLLTAAYPTAALWKPVGLAITMAVIADCFMTFFGSTANDAAFNAHVADVTTDETRGRVMGVLEILTWVALLIVYGASGLVIEAFGYPAFFYLVGGLVAAGGIVGGMVIKERCPPPSGEPYLKRLASSLSPSFLRENRALFLLLLGMGLWGMAQNVFFPYLMIYVQHYLGFPIGVASLINGSAILVGGILMAYPCGILVDRIGRKRAALIAVGLECAGLLAFSFARDPFLLFAGGVMWLGPQALWSVSMGAWTKDLFPEDRRGQSSGFVVLFTVAFTMVPGPIIGSALIGTFGIPGVIDGRGGFIPTPLIFQAGALASLLAAIPVILSRSKTPMKASEA